MNKRDAIFSLIDPARRPIYTPAAFFLHFDPAYQRGQAAVDKHLEFFRFTGMDFVKIQYEHPFPYTPSIEKPRDWVKAPLFGEEFFAEPLAVVKGLVEAAKAEAPVVMTLYSPFMLAGQMVGEERLVEHLREDPMAVKPGLETVTESLLNFVRGCIRLGVDGFYTSTQGGEANRLGGTGIFEDYIRPTDLAVWDVISPACPFNILHVCDYRGPYTDLALYLGYHGQVVNASLHVGGKELTPSEVSRMFNRPFMGGLERLGILATGTPDQVRAEARRILESAPERFILAADCTVPSETPWENLRAAVEEAHNRRG